MQSILGPNQWFDPCTQVIYASLAILATLGKPELDRLEAVVMSSYSVTVRDHPL
jgi:hypothetical protein